MEETKVNVFVYAQVESCFSPVTFGLGMITP